MTPAPDTLAAALRVSAAGLIAEEAAVELLITHACWLHRSDFLHRCVDTWNTNAPTGHTLAASIEWTATITALDQGQLPCCGSEASILRLAASLAEGIPVDLRDTLTGLDHLNTNLVQQAVRHTTGHP